MKNLFLFIYPAMLFRNSLKFTVIVAGLGSILAPARRHVPAIVTHGMYRPDPFLGRPSFNCKGATRLFTVPGGECRSPQLVITNWRLPIEERAYCKTRLGGANYQLRTSALPPPSQYPAYHTPI